MSTLAELRQANLREQKEKIPAPEPIPALETPPSALESQVLETQAPVLESPPPARVEAARPPVPEPAPSVAEERAPALSLVTEADDAADAFLNRVRARQARKIMHSAGVKVTADMTPALFARAKRYCHDHGNVTLRQVLLDLLSEYLDEEGY